MIDGGCDFSPCASSAMEDTTETKFGTKVARLGCEDDAQTVNTCIACAQRRESVRYHTQC